MKKLLVIITTVFIITGCSLTQKLDNTPTKKTEAFLNKYQILDESVLTDLDNAISSDTILSDSQRRSYRDIIKDNYQKMTYVIKDEIVDGKDATVTTEIEVIDYATILSNADSYLLENPEEFQIDNEYDENLFNDYRLKQLKDAKEKVKYTIDFTLTKIDDEWVLDNPTSEAIDKINGIYPR